MADKKRADVLAGDSALAGKLKRRRMAMDDGDASGGQADDPGPFKVEPKPDINGADQVLRRGYFSEKG